MDEITIEEAIRISAQESVRFWPEFSHLIGGGELISMEDNPDDALKVLLDKKAGIDALRIGVDGRPQPVSLRTQWMWPYHRPHNSFTVRKSVPSQMPTEFEKLGKAILHGYLRPYYTIHIYAKMPRGKGDLYSVGIVKTDDLYNYAIGYSPKIKVKDDTEFFSIPWDDLEAVGIQVKQQQFSEVENEKEFDLEHRYYLIHGWFDI